MVRRQARANGRRLDARAERQGVAGASDDLEAPARDPSSRRSRFEIHS